MKFERLHWFMLAVVVFTLAVSSYVTQEPVRIVGQFLLSLLLGAPLLYFLHRRDQARMRELKARIEEAIQLNEQHREQLEQLAKAAQAHQLDVEKLQRVFARAKPSRPAASQADADV